MDSFEFNKIAMAVLATIFAIFGVTIISEAIFHGEAPEQPAYILAEVDESGGGEEADTGPAYEPVAPLLASADPAAGENVFKKCASCHTVEQGGQNKVGPNLHNIVGRDIATVDGFSYSNALKEYGEGKQWTHEELNGFLWKPKTFVNGTAMGFVGLKDVQDRADVIAYLRSFTDNPPPLPDPAAAEAENGDGGDTASAEGAAENGEMTDSDAAAEPDSTTESESSETDAAPESESSGTDAAQPDEKPENEESQ